MIELARWNEIVRLSSKAIAAAFETTPIDSHAALRAALRDYVTYLLEQELIEPGSDVARLVLEDYDE